MASRRIIDKLQQVLHGTTGDGGDLVDLLLEHLPLGMAFLDREGFELPIVNRKFREISGGCLGDCSNLSVLLNRLIPDNKVYLQVIELMHEGIRSADPVRMVWEVPVVRDGDDAWLLFYATPLESHYLLLWLEDVTERKRLSESEEQFRALVDQASDSFFLMDAKGYLLDVNPAACEGLGYSREELLKMRVSDINAGFSAEQHIDRYWEPLQRGQPVIFETRHLRKDGSTFPVEVVLGMVNLREGRRFLGIQRDLTWRKQTEEALRRSEERHYKLQVELDYAAQVQRNLLPASVPVLDKFEFAARSRPAQHVAGDFYDWEECNGQTMMIALGDVMGKGMAAAMLMATVRSVLRGVARKSRPDLEIEHAEKVLHQDLDRSDSFVTLFYSYLNLASKQLDYVDCGHGHVFLRRNDGRVEELLPRGLPLGVPDKEVYQQGSIVFAVGDALILYSDGLIDALSEQALDYTSLAKELDGASSADEMLARLMGLVPEGTTIADDLTVLVVRCKA
jgi:PAS domain S-box-containing protein